VESGGGGERLCSGVHVVSRDLSGASGLQPDVMAPSDNWGCATPKQEGSSLE